jgi:4,5-dihydroxyphthalate decarboxylase
MTQAPTKTLSLMTAIGSYGHHAGLKNGSIASDRITLQHIDLSPITIAFRRMVRGLEFDISEMAISTYLCAKDFGKPFTAIPVFPVRLFHHDKIMYNVNSGIQGPKDLEGKRVGIRGYTVTMGVQVRGILQSRYGVDLDKVTWVLAGDEHVAEYKAPDNVISAPEGGDLVEMLNAGDLDAIINMPVDGPNLKPLIADAHQADLDYFRNDGIFPINHTVVVKDELLASEPWLADELFRLFSEAQTASTGSASDKSTLAADIATGADPMETGGYLPYGISANLKALEAVSQFVYDQKVVSKRFTMEELFAPSTLST